MGDKKTCLSLPSFGGIEFRVMIQRVPSETGPQLPW